MYHFVIVEDNLQTAQTIRSFLERIQKETGMLIQTTIYSNAEDLLDAAANLFDLILLDIELPGISGMDAARELRQQGIRSEIIFVTNLAQYAVSGYEVDALDFIVKPVTYTQFSMKIKKALQILSNHHAVNIAVSVDRELRFLASDTILYIESQKHDLYFHTTEAVFRTRGSLQEMEEKLRDAHFVRISSFCLVNMDYIAGISARGIRLFHSQDELPVSRSRKKEIFSTITQYLGGTI